MSATRHDYPYWRLSAYYGFYFAALGVLVPYWSLYLRSNGFGYAEIGQLMAILLGTKVIAPNLWGWLADHSGQRLRIVRLASLASVLSFLPVFWVDSFWGLAIVMALFSFFWNASLPQFEVITLRHLGPRAHHYARIRLWGSVGFILAVLGIGAGIQHLGIGLIPVGILGIYLGLWLSTLSVGERPGQTQDHPAEAFNRVLLRPEVLTLFAVWLLMQASHGPYYTFYSIYLEDRGLNKTLISWLWALGVIAEILVFLVTHRLLQHQGAWTMLRLSLLIAALRWLIIGGWPDHLGLLLLAQLGHAATFGLFHAASIALVSRYFVGHHQGRGQALYSSLSFGLGGALGSLISGHAWESLGPLATYCGAAAAAFLAWGLTQVVSGRQRDTAALTR